MNKIALIISTFIASLSFSQAVLTPLSSNPRLYYPALKAHYIYRANDHKADVVVQYGNILVETDTLSLPFVDDFSFNTLKPFHYNENYIYSTILNAFGPCDSFMQVTTTTARFMMNQSWDYTFNTTLHRIDSTAKAPIVFNYFAGLSGDCFYQPNTTLTVYPEYYTYTFDSTTGAIRTQTLVTNDTLNPDTIISYVPVLYKSKMPKYVKWIDNYAYHNYTYPTLPPTIGVATLDGMNEYGRPYNNGSPTNWGPADKLTSKPIDLSGLGAADSVYLSFFYEPRGNGDLPNSKDSLCLEILNGSSNKWDRVWSTPGFAIAPAQPDTFHQVMYQIPFVNTLITKYLYNGFQFRFVNYATLAGNNDHWHIDYVRLGKNRTYTDTAINDIAYMYEFPSLLKNYEEMPAWQYQGGADIVDSIHLFVSNLNPSQAVNNPPATNYNVQASETYPSATPLLNIGNTFNSGPINSITLFPSTQYTIPAASPDSLSFTSQASISVSNTLLANDTISRRETLYNILGYDDGSAEHAFGLINLNLKKFGYEFNLHKPDSLVGFQVLFTNIDVDVSNLVFVYNLWDSIRLNDAFFLDSAVYVSNNQTPFYIDSVNGFATYRISPMYVPKHFYFGWAQTDTRNLQIGYDVNSTKGYSHMYNYTNGTWKKINISPKGSPMIRLILGHSTQIPSGIEDIVAAGIKAYPNPTDGIVTFELPNPEGDYEVALYNTMGQIAFNKKLTSNTIDISTLETGIYMLRLTDTKTGIVYQNKLLKN